MTFFHENVDMLKYDFSFLKMFDMHKNKLIGQEDNKTRGQTSDRNQVNQPEQLQAGDIIQLFY